MASLIKVRTGGNDILLNLDKVRYIEEQRNAVTGEPQDVCKVIFQDGTYMMVRESLGRIEMANLDFDFEMKAAANSSV